MMVIIYSLDKKIINRWWDSRTMRIRCCARVTTRKELSKAYYHWPTSYVNKEIL